MTFRDEVLADTPKLYGEFNGNMNDTIVADTWSGTPSYYGQGQVSNLTSSAAFLNNVRINNPLTVLLDSNTTTTNMTYEFVFATSDTTGTMFQFSNGSGATNATHVRIMLIDGILHRQNNNGSGTHSFGVNVADFEWHHLVLAKAGTAGTWFLDGQEIGTTTEPNPSDGRYLYVGMDRHTTNSEVPMWIDDAAAYEYTANQAWVTRHYNATGIAPTPPPATPFRGWGMQV